MTYAKPKHKTIEQNSQFYDQLSRVKRTGGQGSVLMRPTLNSRGTFVKRSVCGSPKALETSLMDKSGYRKDFESLKHMLKKLTSTLVDSEHVEEIYPSDDKIQDRLKADLGG